tara:strand:- start:974 stop:1405 length:432 start_codon:yes stop_codon:yes gene_type:complete
MSGFYKYLIISNLNLIIQFHQNDLTFEGIKKLKQTIINDSKYNPEYNVIIDLRLADVKMTPNELQRYGNWVQDILNDTKKNMALLTSNPNQVTSATLYRLNDNFTNLNYEVFSTMEAALRHIDIDISNMQFIETEIDKLKEEV